MDSINLYCDESNHLLHNDGNFMILGFTSCRTDISRKIHKKLRSIKAKHGLDEACELKWTKVSMSKMLMYEEIIDLFFSEDSMQFRCVIADKTDLDYERFNITHDDWYYRMYYLLLGKTLLETNQYNIYLDIKDTCSGTKTNKLKQILNNSYYDFSAEMIRKIQLVNSHHVGILQITDLFIGAIGYYNNGYSNSPSKLAFVELLKSKAPNDLNSTTPLNYRKFNIFKWGAR